MICPLRGCNCHQILPPNTSSWQNNYHKIVIHISLSFLSHCLIICSYHSVIWPLMIVWHGPTLNSQRTCSAGRRWRSGWHSMGSLEMDRRGTLTSSSPSLWAHDRLFVKLGICHLASTDSLYVNINFNSSIFILFLLFLFLSSSAFSFLFYSSDSLSSTPHTLFFSDSLLILLPLLLINLLSHPFLSPSLLPLSPPLFTPHSLRPLKLPTS